MDKINITLEEIAAQMPGNSDWSDMDAAWKTYYYTVRFDGEDFGAYADVDIDWSGLERFKAFVSDDSPFSPSFPVDLGDDEDPYTEDERDRDLQEAQDRWEDCENLDDPGFCAAAEDLLGQINDYIDHHRYLWLDWLWELSIEHNRIKDEAEAEDWLAEFRGDPGYNLPPSLTADELLKYWNDKVEEEV